MNYLRENSRRNASESRFFYDKRTTGGMIYRRKKGEERNIRLLKEAN